MHLLEDESKVEKWKTAYEINQIHPNIFGISWLKNHEEFTILRV